MTTSSTGNLAPSAEQLETNKRTAAGFHAPFRTGDVDALNGYLAGEWANHPRNPGEDPGPDGFKATITFIRSVFPDIGFDVQDVIADGDKVLVRSLARGTHTGETLGPPTGKPVAFRTMDLHRFRADGKIIESWHTEDIYAMLATIGLIPNIYRADLDPYPGWD